MKMKDLYQNVTDMLIKDIENGTPTWVRPWKTSKKNGVGLFPANATSGRSYKGVNIPILWGATADAGFSSNAWLTFRQAEEAGGNIAKGSKGTTVVFTKWFEREDDKGKTTKAPMLRTYTVFNAEQAEGIEPNVPPVMQEDYRLDEVDKFISGTMADVNHGGDMACYEGVKDTIQMPPSSAFESPEAYYAVLLHELTHWSGGKSRLKRDMSGKFGSKEYAKEELIAELGAAFLCAQLSIEGTLRHPEYLNSWLKVLKEDNRAIFRAASYASHACDYLTELAVHTEH